MAFLESLSQGLRGAGSVLSQDVYQTNVQEDRLRQQELERRRTMIAQQLIEGAKSGAIQPEIMQQGLKRLGYGDMPSIGPSVAVQGQQEDLRAKQEQAALVRQLPEIMASGDQAKIQALMARIAPAQFVAGQFQREGTSQEPIVRLQAAEKKLRDAGDHRRADQVAEVIINKELGGSSQGERAFRALRRYQSEVDAGRPLTPEKEMDAQSQRSLLEQQRMTIDPASGRAVFAQPITIPDSISVGRGASSPGKPPPNTLPDPAAGGRRGLDAGSEKELQGMADGYVMAKDLAQAFKPGFGGFGSDVVGLAVKEFGRRVGLGNTGEMAQFWEGYEQWVTDMRKEKYGLTLTGNELEQFERFRAKPSQTGVMIKNNLGRQVQLVEGALGRRMTGLAQGGFNPAQIEGAVGWGRDRPSNFVTPKPSTDKPADDGWSIKAK